MSSGQDLSKELTRLLAAYSEEIETEMDLFFQAVADRAAGILKATSPKRKGKYASHWRVTKDKKGSYIIHNQPSTYRLTHLLERSHLLRNGGRSKAQPHIKPVEEKVIQEVEEGIERIARR